MNNLQNSESTFNFDQYIVPNNAAPDIPKESQNNESEKNEPFNFDTYLPKEPPSILQEFGRHVARTGARAAETVVGFPGDMINFARFLSEKLPKGPSFLEKEPNFVQKKGQELLGKLPSSQELKEFSSYLTSGFTDPQSAKEELGDDITSLATSLLIPSKDPTKFKSLLNAIGLATVSKGVGKGIESLGGGVTEQAAGELGSLFLTGLLNAKTANKFVSDQFQQARAKIPTGAMVNTNRLKTSLISLEKDLSRGISTTTKTEVKNSVEQLRKKASSGRMDADEIVQSFHDINERINSKKLFDELHTSEKKILKHRYDEFKNEIVKEISDYGKSNPSFYKQWKDANNAYATIAQSKKVSNFLQSKLGSLPKHLTSTVAIELFLGHPKAAVATVGAAGAVKTGELLYRIGKSPKLREHYLNVIKEAGNENLPAVIKNLSALQEEADKMDHHSQ